jgi:hypothetical protein
MTPYEVIAIAVGFIALDFLLAIAVAKHLWGWKR